MVRVFMSVLFAGFLLLVILGRYAPDTSTPSAAMWAVSGVGMLAMLYTAVNSFNALRHSLGQPARLVYVGMLFSLLPLLVAAYAIAVWQYSPNHLSPFQVISILFGGVASVTDLVLFSWLLFGNTRGAFNTSRRAA